MVGRWMALGGLGWINLVESQVADGCPITEADRANLATVSRRLAALVARLDAAAAQAAEAARPRLPAWRGGKK